MPLGNLAKSDGRREDRDEVHYRARATHADGRTLQLLIVNISPHGFMARCDASVAEDDQLRVTLPGLGAVPADVRWALGGRVGCELGKPIGLGDYYELLAAILR
ncbi:pilus assembly protein PilZ [Sphingomonas sp. Leaf33]|uniref:PilZ domain-containing protein n=1 Tax=Sphingomonas sp. Leaf33 TaxID=1736215 RepID=UPI0006FF8C01|nr:PilZ domain-containing protein [Sphingomonas sp. Leaf33]KQN26446.1 pilus assembly protein PilZ [Sphingomonas sp. Leaf33]